MLSTNMDFNPDFGEWSISQHPNQNQECALLTPKTPVFRQLIEWLDTKEDVVIIQPVTILEEAMAIESFCFYYGSYFYALTMGRPYPGFKKNQCLSRTSDEEMKRINIESSAALAFVIGLKETNIGKYNNFIRKVLVYLSEKWAVKMKPYTETGVKFWNKFISRCPLSTSEISKLREKYQTVSQREEANSMANYAFRNESGIENFHAGICSLGISIPGFKRFYQSEINQMMGKAIRKLEYWIDLRGSAPQDTFYYSVYIKSLSPSGWTLEDETSSVFYSGWPNVRMKDVLV